MVEPQLFAGVNGMSLSHRQKFGKVDLVAGGNMLSDKNVCGPRAAHAGKLQAALPTFLQCGNLVQGSKASTSKWVDSSSGTTSSRMLTCHGRTSSEDRWFNWHVDAWAAAPMSGGSHHFNLRAYETARYGEDTIPTMVSRLTMFQNRYVRHLGDHWTTIWVK